MSACGLVRLDEQLTEMEARKGLYYKIQSDARKQEVDAAKKKIIIKLTYRNSIKTSTYR